MQTASFRDRKTPAFSLKVMPGNRPCIPAGPKAGLSMAVNPSTALVQGPSTVSVSLQAPVGMNSRTDPATASSTR